MSNVDRSGLGIERREVSMPIRRLSLRGVIISIGLVALLTSQDVEAQQLACYEPPLGQMHLLHGASQCTGEWKWIVDPNDSRKPPWGWCVRCVPSNGVIRMTSGVQSHPYCSAPCARAAPHFNQTTTQCCPVPTAKSTGPVRAIPRPQQPPNPPLTARSPGTIRVVPPPQ